MAGRREAAFFDLDRTLIPRATGSTFGRHLNARDLGPSIDLPIADLVIWFFDTFGESYINMAMAKQLVRSSAGWPVADVEAAAADAADELVDQVPLRAKRLLEEHREAGRLLVMATTSPSILVTPLAEKLGFDQVIATKWADDGENLTGDYDGPFVWGAGKRDAVVAWAGEQGLNLRKCHAYSDSYFDSSLLDTVGHPVAVNPDAALAGVAVLKGWPITHFDAPEGVIKVAGLELQDWLRPFNRPELMPIADFSFTGIENIPREGPAILAFNHRSYFDAATVALLTGKSGRPCRFLGKKEVFDAPVVGPLAKLLGGIRVDRASGSTAPIRSAIRTIEQGEMVAIAPQGTIPRGPAFFEPELKARKGVARLAHETRAPVIPVGLWGTERVWPRNQRMPTIDLINRPPVDVRVGPPVELDYEDLEVDTKAIMSAISDLLPAEANRAHTPTEAELARTYPAGYKGDPTKEADRRPGTDT